jgi:hypothetical protein
MPQKNRTACKRRKCQRSRSQKRRRNNNRRTRTIRGGFSPIRKTAESISEWKTKRRTAAAAAESRRTLGTESYEPARWYSSPVRALKEWKNNRVVPTGQSTAVDIVQQIQDIRFMPPAQQQLAMARLKEYVGNSERRINQKYADSNARFGVAASDLENALSRNEFAWNSLATLPHANSNEVNELITEATLGTMAPAGKTQIYRPPPPNTRPNVKVKIATGN